MTVWKYFLNCPSVNPICLRYYANFRYISAADERRSRGLPAEAFVYAQPRRQQRSVAGTTLFRGRRRTLCEKMRQDRTPEATKCGQFNYQLVPFINSLRSQ